MKQIEWVNDKDFQVAGVNFRSALDDHSLRTSPKCIPILKNKYVLDNYREVLGTTVLKNILEFGIYQGGSPALFSLLFDTDKFVGIDLCQPVEGFDAFCASHPVGKNIRTHYGVSQTDKNRIDGIIADEFGSSPIDLIVDDASHFLAETRRTFEIAFPRLKPGGIYVIEDWGWAHWNDSDFLMGKPAMSILIMELTMLCASRSDLISEVRVFPSFAFIKKGLDAPALNDFSLDTAYSKRGVDIFSIERVAARGLERLNGTERDLRVRIGPT